MFFSWFITLLFTGPVLSTFCDELQCSNVVDYVCASTEARDGTEIIMRYHNICFLRKKQCQLRDYVVIKEIPHQFCNIEKGSVATTPMPNEANARRVSDFSVVGAHQTCNHTCPIYCTETYDPACVQIWKDSDKTYSERRTMINHCHIDLYSCATGLNVTILPISSCLRNPLQLLFITQVAAMKSLKLLSDGHFTEESRKSGSGNKKLWEIVENIFDRHPHEKASRRTGKNVPLPRSNRRKLIIPSSTTMNMQSFLKTLEKMKTK